MLRRLNDSLAVDARLYREDLQGSRGWARELHRSGYISDEDHSAIQLGLNKVCVPTYIGTLAFILL